MEKVTGRLHLIWSFLLNERCPYPEVVDLFSEVLLLADVREGAQSACETWR